MVLKIWDLYPIIMLSVKIQTPTNPQLLSLFFWVLPLPFLSYFLLPFWFRLHYFDHKTWKELWNSKRSNTRAKPCKYRSNNDENHKTRSSLLSLPSPFMHGWDHPTCLPTCKTMLSATPDHSSTHHQTPKLVSTQHTSLELSKRYMTLSISLFLENSNGSLSHVEFWSNNVTLRKRNLRIALDYLSGKPQERWACSM